ncbi:MAG: NAD-dependent epimerase/dehydratase family protein, partial [Nocardioidaceae bacterium]
MKVLLTGAAGFLGWHTRARLHALTDHEVVPVTRATWSELPQLAGDVDAIIHVAGVNRATPDEVERGNVELAEAVVAAARETGSKPRIVFSNSIQSGNDSPYGTGKAVASDLIASAA